MSADYEPVDLSDDRQKSQPVGCAHDVTSNHSDDVLGSKPTMKARVQTTWARTRTVKGRFSRLWVWELAASVFSLVCIAVTVVVLRYEDGKRLDRWPLAISPNAVISFITTLAKSSSILVLAEVIGQLRWLHLASEPRVLSDLQLFDDASRGPLGAGLLVLQIGHKAVLASCASILIVAALLTDPFAQLVLTFPSRATSAIGQVAMVRVAQNYDAGSVLAQVGSNLAAVPENAPFALQGAIVSTAFGAAPNFDLTCSTSNCTFPPFTTLGVCSACQDVTALTNTACGRSQGSIATYCNTTVPHQLLPATNMTYYIVSGATGIAVGVWNSSTMNLFPEPASPFLDYGQAPLLSAFTTLKIDVDSQQQKRQSTGSSQVNQCRLSYCAKTYNNVVVRNGQTSIGSIDESPMVISSHEAFAISDGPITYMTMQATTDNQPTGQNYTMNYNDYLNIARYMEDVLNSTVGFRSGTYALTEGGRMAPAFGLAMYNSSNLSDMVSKIADSMTNSMRTSQRNFTSVDGTAIAYATFIHIEWKWLALPIIITGLAPILLIIVMIRSRAHGMEAWKSSSMPLMFYRLDGWDKHSNEFKDTDDMFWRSKNMKGLLSLDGGNRVFAKSGITEKSDPTIT